MKLKDPGKDKRKQAWKRPSKKVDRDRLRDERIATMKEVFQIENSDSVQNKRNS